MFAFQYPVLSQIEAITEKMLSLRTKCINSEIIFFNSPDNTLYPNVAFVYEKFRFIATKFGEIVLTYSYDIQTIKSKKALMEISQTCTYFNEILMNLENRLDQNDFKAINSFNIDLMDEFREGLQAKILASKGLPKDADDEGEKRLRPVTQEEIEMLSNVKSLSEFVVLRKVIMESILEEAGPETWEKMMLMLNFDCINEEILDFIIHNPRTDRATAARLYWRFMPYRDEHIQNSFRQKDLEAIAQAKSSMSSYSFYEMSCLMQLEQNLLNHYYINSNYGFDPYDDEGTNRAANRDASCYHWVPEELYTPIEGEDIQFDYFAYSDGDVPGLSEIEQTLNNIQDELVAKGL